MYLFFDTETTGAPKNYKAPVTDLKNWPRLVQIAWIKHDKNGETLGTECFVIKPNGFTIPAEATNIHGITTDHALEHGVDLLQVLEHLSKEIDTCQYLIAHNINFDQNIIGAEFLRHKMVNSIPRKKLLCTMTTSTNYCAIKGSYGFKYPRLTELHQKLFKCTYSDAHNALTDITATAKCFWEMRKRGLI